MTGFLLSRERNWSRTVILRKREPRTAGGTGFLLSQEHD